jgi:glycosyltransferase involved in cell wall biosynthesis
MGTFANGLAARGHEVTVICEQPNHPVGVFHPGYGRRPVVAESTGDIRIHRLWVFASRVKTPGRRVAFYGTFAAGAAISVLAAQDSDVVFVTSPPMPGAIAVGWAAAARGLPFVLDVRDPWPAAAEALGELSNRRVIRVLERAERQLYRNARRVTATTVPFCKHIDRVAERQVSQHLPNGALDALVELPYQAREPEPRFVIGYAGNLGIAQGLGIVFEAAKILGDDFVFRLLGDGPLSEALRRERDHLGLHNVEIRPSVPIDEVASFMQTCDALLVPLGAHPAFADFIPSKLYDAMAVGRPVLLAARGEAAKIVQEVGCGVVVQPENGEQLATAARRLANDREHAALLGLAGRHAAGVHARSRQLDVLEAVLQNAAVGLPR